MPRINTRIKALNRAANLISIGSRVAVPQTTTSGGVELRNATVLEVAERPSLEPGRTSTVLRVNVDGRKGSIWLSPSNAVRI